MRGGERQHAGSRTHIDDIAELLLGQAIQHRETPARRGVMTGAERTSRVDQQRPPALRRRRRMGAGVNHEAAFADRLQTFLRQGHPILRAERLHLCRRALGAGHQRTDRRQHGLIRFVLCIGIEPPAFDIVFHLFGGHQHGVDRQVVSGVNRLRLRARARQGYAPAVSGHSLLRSRRAPRRSWRRERQAPAIAPSPPLLPAWRPVPGECRRATCHRRGSPDNRPPCRSS